MNCVQLDIQERVAWVTLNRPEAANAINHEVRTGLNAILEKVEGSRNDVRCLVLSGAGAHFCSGVDLRATGDVVPPPRSRPSMERGFLDYTIERLMELRKPVVAAVNGPATGAGMTLALTADVMLMADSAYLWPSFIQLGMVPDNGMTKLLSHRIGQSRARAVLMLAERIDAKTAHAWGLAYEVTAAQSLHERAAYYAARLAAGPRSVLGRTRMLMNTATEEHLHQHICSARAAHTETECQEQIEGCEAFFAHRAPRF